MQKHECIQVCAKPELETNESSVTSDGLVRHKHLKTIIWVSVSKTHTEYLAEIGFQPQTGYMQTIKLLMLAGF